MGSLEPLGNAEEQALSALEPELRAHGELCLRAFNEIGLVCSRLPDREVWNMPQSLKVALHLLSRLSNDLRSAALLALRGYAVQACSLVASIYEAAYSIAFIGSDEAAANQWISHDDPTRPFRPALDMTRNVIAKLGLPTPEDQTASEYRVYTQLCMAKHANPLFQQQHGYELQGGNVLLKNGPDTSESAIRAAWFALEHGARLACLAVDSFIANHIPLEASDDLLEQVRQTNTIRKELAGQGKARWGTEDPFPGRWRR